MDEYKMVIPAVTNMSVSGLWPLGRLVWFELHGPLFPSPIACLLLPIRAIGLVNTHARPPLTQYGDMLTLQDDCKQLKRISSMKLYLAIAQDNKL